MKIDISTKKHQGLYAEIDDEDASHILRYRWAATLRRKKFYVRAIIDGKDTLLHRYLMMPPPGLCVDHINGDPLDNRRENLRTCTKSENNVFAYQAWLLLNPKPPSPPPKVKIERVRVHTVKRKLADGTIRIHRYNRDTKERLENEFG